jgi:glycosyltransferase involved in cell wall biosynthesis
MDPTVSVVIPAYNCGVDLEKTLANALEQTGVSLEIVVVDNSTDESCKRYADYADRRVRYVFRQPPGVAPARNLGIQLSTGAYVAFLDADDAWLPNKLSAQAALFEKYPDAGLVFTDTMMCSDEEVFRPALYSDVLQEWSLEHRTELPESYCGDMYARLLKNNCMHTSSVMVRRKVFEQVGLFDERVQVVKIAEDYDLWLRIAKQYPVGFVDRVYCKYKVRPDVFSGGMDVRGLRWLDAQIAVREKHRRAHLVPAEHVGLLGDVLSERYWELGHAHFGANRFRDARKCFWEALRLEPLHPRVWVYLASTFLPTPLVESARLFKRGWRRPAAVKA